MLKKLSLGVLSLGVSGGVLLGTSEVANAENSLDVDKVEFQNQNTLVYVK